jgi:choline dehydrogenase-like flavoprotein
MKAIPSEAIPQQPEGHVWDVIVIGAGAGGAAAGLNLARLGRSVLFVERGKLVHHDPAVARGDRFRWNGDPEKALDHGWWPRPFYEHRDEAAPVPTKPLIGCGVGGSTIHFNSVMDRFRPQDFTPRRFFPDAPDASLPDAWPVSYEEMVPFYERAERLFRVRGTRDPLGPPATNLLEPPPASDRERAIFEALSGAGLNPYRIHYALEQVPGCDGCAGMLCPHPCRNDAARICLYPALEQYEAKIIPNCRAIRLEEARRVVERVICDWNGRRTALRARVFILAANAFLTPALLQRSANDRFPSGLANSSGLVGRNLMLHASAHVFVRPKRISQSLGFEMAYGLSLNDFYVHNGEKLGNFHAHPFVNRDQAIRFVVEIAWGLDRLPGPLRYLVASKGTFLSRQWTAFAGILEDLPYPGNSVAAKAGSDQDIVYRYRYPPELRRRARIMVDRFKTAVAPLLDIRALEPPGDLNGSHVCGTCRFGDDPRTSVLGRDNRAHDLDNLYVLDASFFPSSGGINPSLTIVANSLRATDAIAQRI